MSSEQEEKAPAPKKRMSDFRKALLWTAIPIVVVGIISAGASISKEGAGASLALGFAIIEGILWGGAILLCIGYAIARERQIALGMLAGIGIGIVGLGLTCFAMGSIMGQWAK